MTLAPLRLGLAALLAVGAAPFVQAQPYSPGPAQAQGEYQQQQDNYQQQLQDQQQQQSQYQDQQRAYAAQRAAYERARARYERDRDAYDAQYGAGAFQRYYSDRPEDYDARYGPGAYERDFGAPVAYPPQGYDRGPYDGGRGGY